MPIITIQRRHAELGRIRLGQKVKVGTSGKTRPDKLDRFRFTSGNEALINDIATLYGGESRAWDNGGKAEFEVITKSTSIPVIVVKGGFSQWMETWSGGGCTHRCDGVNNALTGGLCVENDPAHVAAKPTTRLSVMLRDVESLGVWRLESHGWNAAAELPAVAEIAMHVGDLVPAVLNLAERRSVKDGKTSRFVVPVLDLLVSKQRLVEIAGGATNPQQIGGTAAAQIEAAPAPDYTEDIADVENVDELRVLWQQIATSGHMTEALVAALTARAAELTHAETPETGDAPSPSASPVSGPDDNSETSELFALQQQILAKAGAQGKTSDEVLADLEQTFAQPVDDLTAAQLREYLEGQAA